MQRHGLERSLSWPPVIHVAGAPTSHSHRVESEPRSATLPSTKSTYTSFEEDLENNPQNHFLSPMDIDDCYYDDWDDSDSDDEGESGEWSAGITDFSLFTEERRKAQNGEQPLSKKWEEVMASQVDALKRSIDRTRKESSPEPAKVSNSENEIPGLTPDTSPELHDDLDVESFHGQTAARPWVPNFLAEPVALPKVFEGQAIEKDGALLPVAMAEGRQKPRAEGDRKLQRPGMKYSRTMSGHVHSWRWPSRGIPSVGEDAEGEDRGEHSGAEWQDEDTGRHQ